jgi:hypothetical protein
LDRARPALFHILFFSFSNCVVLCIFICVVLRIVVCDCVLPPGDNPIAVNKHNNNKNYFREGPEGIERNTSTLSLISALEEVGGQRHAPAALTPGKRLGIHFTEG